MARGFLRGSSAPSSIALPRDTHTAIPAPVVPRFRFLVTATGPVFAYVLDSAGLQQFRDGEHATVYGGIGRPLVRHDQTVTLPSPDQYFLLIINPSMTGSVDFNCEFHFL